MRSATEYTHAATTFRRTLPGKVAQLTGARPAGRIFNDDTYNHDELHHGEGWCGGVVDAGR